MSEKNIHENKLDEIGHEVECGHYQFPQRLHRALKTTNGVERIHKEFKRRSRSMEGMGETTLTVLLAFTALRLEMGWRQRPVDTYVVDHLGGKKMGLPSLSDLGAESLTVH